MLDTLKPLERVFGIDPELEKWLDELDLSLHLDREEDKPVWTANPGRQFEAEISDADLLFYGGAAGGGKTDLAIGVSYMHHHRAAIFRRVYPNLRDVIERSKELFGGIDGARFNESLHRWQFPGGKTIELESCPHEDDKFKQRGRPRDLYVFDEVTEFSESQFQFITGWLRTTRPGQRTRVIATFNPPTDSEGTWVINYITPWLAHLYPEKFTHDNPAEPGELRWFATIAGERIECDGPDAFEFEGETIRPISMTFIPAFLDDNPYLRDSGYRARLQALPEPLRSQLLHGDFAMEGGRDVWQVIPTDWVKKAQKRWFERERPKMPISSVGIDVARGGRDALTITKRYGQWFDEPVKIPGVDVDDGPAAAGYVYEELKDQLVGAINVDVIGVGSSAYDSIKAIWPDETFDLNVSKGSTYIFEDADENPIFRMANVRAACWWQFRQALDPEGPYRICLPPGAELLQDLTSTRYKLTAGGVGSVKVPVVTIEPKKETRKRLGRSPDVGESFLYAWYSEDDDDFVVVSDYKGR